MGRLQHFLHCNVVKTESAKMMTYVERETMAMLHRAFYARDDSFYEAHAMDRDTCLGHPTSGGTVANLEALWVARNTLFEGCASAPSPCMHIQLVSFCMPCSRAFCTPAHFDVAPTCV